MGLFDFLKKKPEIPHEALTTWVHRRTHFEILNEVARQRGHEPFKAGNMGDVFGTVPALMTEDGPIAVTSQHLKALGLSYKDASIRAMMNVGEAFSSVPFSNGLCVWKGPNAEATVVLMSLLADQIPFKGRPVAMAPAANLGLMAGGEDVEALERMLEIAERAYAQSDEFRSLRAVSWKDGEVSAWLPPEGHPLRARFIAAASKTRRHEAEALHGMLAADRAPLTHLAVMPADQGGQLVAGWIRSANVMMPRVDRVALIDTDDAPHARVEVDFDTLLEEMPEAFEEVPLIGEHRVLYRARGELFPSPRERAFLLERMAWDRSHPDSEDREVPGEELLALWDSGAPLLVNVFPEGVGLTAADRRYALVTQAQFGERFRTLPARDKFSFHLLSGDDGASEALASLRDELECERPQLMSSLHVETLREASEASAGDEMTARLAADMANTLEPIRLFPMVRPPGYDEGSTANELGMVKGASNGKALEVKRFSRLSRQFHEGMSLELVSDRGEGMTPLNSEFVPPVLVDALWRSAMLNLQAASLVALTLGQAGVYEGPWRDDYDASRVLLLPELVKACVVKGAPLIFAPTVGRVWVTGSDDVAGIAHVLDEIDAYLGSGATTTPYAFRQMLFGAPWVLRDGEPCKYEIPAGHPLAPRIAELDDRLEKRRDESRGNIGALAQAAYSKVMRTKAGEA